MEQSLCQTFGKHLFLTSISQLVTDSIVMWETLHQNEVFPGELTLQVT